MNDDKNIYTIYKKQERSLNRENLNSILEDVKKNPYYGDIVWSNQYKSIKATEEEIQVIKKIEEQLIKNNKEYSRFPNDYIHCLLSKCAYRNDLEKIQRDNHFTECNNSFLLNKCNSSDRFTEHQDSKWKILNDEWKILKIKNEFIDKSNIPIYTAVLFVNESRKQLVLSHKGLDVDFKSLKKENSEINNNIQGIMMNQIVPQLTYCYEFTEEANKIAIENNYYLSFTGYSNGAWLSESSIYYSYKFFKNQKTKAVLFDSPGMLKSEEDIKSNIINSKTDFNLHDLNIVNYLTTPCFSNSCNKHIGQSYRIFVQDNDTFRKSNKWLEFLEKIKEIPLIGDILYNKNLFFFLDGLYTMFDHGNLDSIIELFDPKTGKPKYYEEIEDWPIVKLTINKKDYENNLKTYISTPIEKLVGLIPIPNLIKKPGAKILSYVFTELTNKVTEKTIPGIHFILNILHELVKGNIDLEQFENAKFYKKINEDYTNIENKTDEKKRSRNKKTEEFNLIFNKSYKTIKVNQNKIILKPNISTNNNDYLLCCLYNLENLNENKSKISTIVYKLLNDLKSKYIIKKKRKGDNEDEFTLETIGDINVEFIFERFIRLNQLTCCKLGEYLSEIKSNDKKNKLEIASRLFSNFNSVFTGRSDTIQEVKNKLKIKQGVILHAFGGCGKSRLAHEIGKIYDKNQYIVRFFNCETKEKLMIDYNQLYQEIFKLKNYDFNNKKFQDVIQEIKNEINYTDNVKLLYIFDNVEKYEVIKDIVESMPNDKIKFIITTRNQDLVSFSNDLEVYSIKIDLFNESDIITYLDKNLYSKKDLDKKIISEIIKFKMKNHQILPLDLHLIVNYINKSFVAEIDELLNEIREGSNLVKNESGELKEHSLNIQECLFRKLKQNSNDAFRLLSYCAYLDPDSISYSLIKLILNDKNPSLIIEKLNESGLIENDKDLKIIKIHRMIQDEIKNYLEKTKEYNLKDIIQKLIQVFLEKIDTIDCNTFIIKNQDQVDSNYSQIEKILEEIIKNKNLNLNLNQYIKLNFKYANYSFYKLNFEKSKEIFYNIYQILEKENDLNKDYLISIVESLIGLVKCYLELNNLIKSIEYLKKSYHKLHHLPINEPRKNDLRAQYYYYYGIIYDKFGNNDKAFEYHKISYEIKKEKLNTENDIEILNSINAIALSYEKNKDWNKAKTYHKKAYEKAKKIVGEKYNTYNHPKIADTLENLGGMYIKLGKIERAKTCYQKAYGIRKNLHINNQPNIELANSYELIANLNRIENKKKLEINNREKCVETKEMLYKSLNENYLKSLKLLARTYTETNNYDKAQEIYENIYEKLKKNKNIEEVKNTEYFLFLCKLINNKEINKDNTYEKIKKEQTNKKKTSYKIIEIIMNNKEKDCSEEFEILKILPKFLLASCSFVEKTIKIWNIESGECLKKLNGHSRPILTFITLSKYLLATGSGDKTIKIWNIESGECLNTFSGHSDLITSLVAISDKLIASGSGDQTIKIWNIKSGECLNTLIGHSNTINILITLSNNLLASGSNDHMIKIWDIESGICLNTLSGHSGRINTLVSLPNNLILSGSCDNTIKIWDLKLNECIRTLPGHSNTINKLLIIQNQILASEFNNHSIRIINIESGECLNILSGHSDSIASLIELPNNLIVSGSRDHTIKIWNIKSGKCLNTLSGHSGWINVLVSLSKNLIASASNDHTIKLWNIVSGECLNTFSGHTSWINTLIILPNNLITCDSDIESKRKIESAECLGTLSGDSGWINTLVVLSKNLIASGSNDKTIKIWDIKSGQHIKTLIGHSSWINSLILLSNNLLASGSSDNTIKIWDIISNQCMKTLSGHTHSINKIIALRNDLIASGSNDQTIKIWDTESGKCLKTLAGHSVWILTLISLHDNLIASGSRDHTIKIWDIELGKCLKTLSGHSGWILTLVKLPNSLIASGCADNTIKIWNIESGECLNTLSGHSGWINSLVALPNNLIASGAGDNTIKIWNVKSGKFLNTLSGHNDSIASLVALPNNLLASGSHDNEIKIWNVGFLSRFSFTYSCLPLFALDFHFGNLVIAYESSFEYHYNLSKFNKKCSFLNMTILVDRDRIFSACSDSVIRIFNIDIDKKNFILNNKLIGHKDLVRCLSFLNDSILISGSDDFTVGFWDIAELKLIKFINVESTVRFILSISDSSFLTASDDLLIKIWDYESGKLKYKLIDSNLIDKSHLDEINSLIMLPDKQIASGSLDRTVKLWNLKKRCLLYTFDCLPSGVYSLLYISKENKNFIIAGCNKDVFVINVNFDQLKLNEFKTLHGHSKEVICLKLIKNNTQFVSGSIDSTIITWNI